MLYGSSTKGYVRVGTILINEYVKIEDNKLVSLQKFRFGILESVSRELVAVKINSEIGQW